MSLFLQVTSEIGLTYGDQQARFQVDGIGWFVPVRSAIVGWG